MVLYFFLYGLKYHLFRKLCQTKEGLEATWIAERESGE
jgi:hypothetical protein